jgi:DNA modification methylase
MSLPKPFWTSPDGRHVIYNSDCLLVLPHLTGVDAVVTDPQYGVDEAYAILPSDAKTPGWCPGVNFAQLQTDLKQVTA